MKYGKKERAEKEVLSDLYNPDRQIRMQAEELIQGNQELLFEK